MGKRLFSSDIRNVFEPIHFYGRRAMLALLPPLRTTLVRMFR